MTPRALLTAIAATALAFAVAIGVAAESTTGVVPDAPRAVGSTIETGSDLQRGVTAAAGARLNAWNDPCVIAV